VKRRGDPGEPYQPRSREDQDDERDREAVLPYERAARATREDADSQDDTNGQLRAMRAVWLSMREEEPPDGGLVDLLAAARTKASTMRARPTLWQRVLAFAKRPPALAFATVVVLVGGAVLFIGRSKGMRADLAAGSSGAVTSYVQPGVEEKKAIGEPVQAPGAARSEPSAKVERAEGAAKAGVEDAPRTTERPAAPTRSTVATVTDEHAGANAGERDADAAGASPAEVRFDAGRRAAAPAAAETRKQALLEQLYRQCESAARRGDCVAVRKMVDRIAKTDRGYRARVEKQASVAKCLEPAAALRSD